jgi:peptidyl-prolyl cis-trans isomerase SurA
MTPRREVTKRQLSRWQQESRRQRITLGSGIFIILAVVVVLWAGWFLTDYRPLHETVIVVNDAEFNMDYYVRALTFYGSADGVVEVIQQNELVRRAATELGISVSDDEVDNELKSFDPPLSTDFRDLFRGELLLRKLRDEYFEQQVPLATRQRHIMAMLLESERQVEEIRVRLEGGETFAELAGELSLDSYSKEQNGDLGWHPEDISPALLGTTVVEEHAFGSEVGALSQPVFDESKIKPVGYWLLRVTEREKTAAEGQAILLGSEEEAEAVRARLEAGEDFAALAEEFSQHEPSREKGGNMGVVRPDTMSAAFDEFFFDPEVELETLSQPIRDETFITRGGYWLIRVVDEEDGRQVDDNDREFLKAKALNEWVSALRDDPENKLESYLDEEKKAWAVERAMRNIVQTRGG